MSMFSWYHQHTVGHHVDTNIPGCDPDLYHFALNADTGMPGFRTSIELRTLPENSNGQRRERFWRKGRWLRIPMSTVGPSLLWDPLSLGNPQFVQAFLGLVPFRRFWMRGLFMHSVGRSIVIWLAIIHPITICLVAASNWLTGAAQAFLFVVTPYAIHGCIFYVFSQVSHVQQECSKLKLDDVSMQLWHHSNPKLRQYQLECEHSSFETTGFDQQSQPAQEWAIHQVENTLDYAVDSRFWLHVSVGLNLQAVHHLFPQVGWGHYTELGPIVRDVCAEFNVKYSVKPSFWDALNSHFHHLSVINDEPYASVWVRPQPGRASRATLELLGQLDQVARKTL